jgi:hypothetical protein
MRERPMTLLYVVMTLVIGAPGRPARAQQPTADPPPARPEPRPRAEAPTPQPGAQPPPAARPADTPPPHRAVAPSGGGPTAIAPPATAPPPAAGAPPITPARAAKNGLVLQLNFGTDFVQGAVGGSAMVYSYIYGGGPGLNGSFSMGYRSRRWIIGLGLDFRRYETEASGDKTAVSVVAFRPTVSYDLVSTYPLALYFTVGLPIGFMATKGDGGGYYTDSSDGEQPVVGFVVGLGARFFFHPQFAVGMEGAFKGLWIFVKTEDYYGEGERVSIGNVAFSGSIFMMAIF